METRPPIRIDPSPSPPFSPRLEKPAAFLSGGKEEGEKKKEKRNFQYRDSPLTLITSDSFRVCFFTYSSFSLSLSNPTGPTLQIHSGFFSLGFSCFLFLLFLILSQRILDNCRCLGIRSYVGFICRKYGVIILRLGRRRDIARFILFYYRMN